MSRLDKRSVKRVLVMLDYGNEQMSDVFDLTALAEEIARKTEHVNAKIELNVMCNKNYADSKYGEPPVVSLESSWVVVANFHSSSDAAFLEDAINYAMPDSIATEELRKKSKRIREKLEAVESQIKTQRLMDAAAIRHQNPIARVKETALLSV